MKSINHLVRLTAAIALAAICSQSIAISEAKKAEIAERIKPEGEVCLKGDSSCSSASATASSGPVDPEETYNKSCVACHGTGAAGAPKVGDAGVWKDRLSKGIETVYDHAINGFNGMPPMGTCMSCSEDDIKAIVDYMVDNSK